MTRFRKVSAVGTVVLLLLVGLPAVTSASHCANKGPWARIASGYYGTGGLGALDGTGCHEGKQVADTRVMLPSADFVLLILALDGTTCSPGVSTTTGAITGHGGFSSTPWSGKSITLTCGASGTAYISDILDVGCGLVDRFDVSVAGFTISPGNDSPDCVPPSGWITASVGTKTACTKTIDRLGNCGGTT